MAWTTGIRPDVNLIPAALDRSNLSFSAHAPLNNTSSAEYVLLSGACALKGRLDLSRAAGIKLTLGRMSVVQANLVDIGS